MTKVPEKADGRSRNERELLQLLAQGEKEIAAGKGNSLDSVLKEAERLAT